MENRFKSKFLFGAAASAPQTEGFSDLRFKSQSTWDYWHQKNPELFFDQIGPNDTNNTFSMFQEDIACLNSIGLNSFRTSISWTRLMPNGIDINQEAVEFYQKFFMQLQQSKIKVFVNLFHFDLPLELEQQGGWTNEQTSLKFAKYAQSAFKLFGDYVDYWITFNEPTVHVECSYMKQCHYPALVNDEKMMQAAFNTILANALAIEQFKKLKLKSKIGIVLIMAPVYARSKSKKDLAAQNAAELLYIKSFADAAIKGNFSQELIVLLTKFNLLPNFTKQQLDIIKNNVVDFIGANYYQPIRVKTSKRKKSNKFIENLFENYDWKKKVVNPYRGWEIYPKGIYDMAQYISKHYPHLDWYVSENGIGVENEQRFIENGIINDSYRIDFLKSHLSYLQKSFIDIKQNKCFGYHMWTLVDCWSWLNAYKNRYGFYHLDHKTKQRSIKQSGLWMQTFIKGE